MKQKTILREASLKGRGLHTGQEVHLTLKPAEVDHGLVFRRIDLHGKPEIRPSLDLVSNLVRSTDLKSGNTKIHTVEHVLSSLLGSGVDNVIIEMDASEPPIMDGSAKHYVNLIQKAEPIEQDKEREYFVLDEPISVANGNSSLIVLPHDGLKITCTSADNRGIHTQHLSIELVPETYIAAIAPARTFTIFEDIEELLKLGMIRGGSLDNAILLKGDKIISKEPLRFDDEFVRHKILDIIGDITLLGVPLKGHIVAVRPSHALNHKLVIALHERYQARKTGKLARKTKTATGVQSVITTETELDINRVIDTLPQRYPFLMIDRVVEFKGDNEIRAIKNVSINEPYFQGHFPGRPYMPGVLQLEAMAQAAGILARRNISKEGKLAFFMSADKVKFRKVVSPGDQLEIHAKITRTRGDNLAVAQCSCRVGGKVVSSAQIMFSFVDDPEAG